MRILMSVVGGENRYLSLTRGQTQAVVFRHVGLRKIPTVD